MKILILTNNDLGLYKFRRELIENLCTNHDVIIALPNGDFIEKLKGFGCEFIPVEFNRRGINPFSDLKQINTYRKLIKEQKPNIVLTYTIKPNIYGGIACRLTKTPYLSNVTGLGTAVENGGALGFIAIFLYRIGLKKANCVLFQNTQNLKIFERKNIVKKNTRLIPGSGVNLLEHYLEEYPSDSAGIHFLFIGRIMKDKGIEELINAFKIVQKRYPSASLDVVGGCDEDYLNLLKTEKPELHIKYHGQQPNVHNFLKNAHCTVLPSYHEGTANVMLESASTGRPVITTRVAGCRETFDEGATGFGCDAGDTDSLVDAMIRFIELPFECKAAMGAAGREKMMREFDRNIVIETYLDELKNLGIGE